MVVGIFVPDNAIDELTTLSSLGFSFIRLFEVVPSTPILLAFPLSSPFFYSLRDDERRSARISVNNSSYYLTVSFSVSKCSSASARYSASAARLTNYSISSSF